MLRSFYLSDLVSSPRRMPKSLSFTWAYICVRHSWHHEEPTSHCLFFYYYSFLISQFAERHGCDQTMAIFYAEGVEDRIFWERQHRLCKSFWVRSTISKNSELLISLMKRTGKNWGWENNWCWNSVEYMVWSGCLCLQRGWNLELLKGRTFGISQCFLSMDPISVWDAICQTSSGSPGILLRGVCYWKSSPSVS